MSRGVRFLLAALALAAAGCAAAAVCVQSIVGLAWDNATPSSGQTIDATEILIDGAPVGTTTGSTYDCAQLPNTLAPGDHLATVRHIGTIDGQPATSAESNAVTLTIAQATGAPEVAPLLRFRQLDSARA